MRFSIAIPAHDRGKNGPIWMKELLDSIKNQTFQDLEIVVSDQSKNDVILNTCKEYSDYFDFKYVRYQGNVPCENINTALDECEGDIIKIMFSDDIFIVDNALEIIDKNYREHNCRWAFSGFCGTKEGKILYDHKIPRWTDYMLEGRNFLSSPSVVSFLNTSKQHFDHQLKLLLDTEFYHRMRWEHGMPHIIQDFLVANRDHDDRISSHQTSQYDMVVQHPEGGWMVNSLEYQYVQNKHKEFCLNRKYPDEN